jgi:hypothetical protein
MREREAFDDEPQRIARVVDIRIPLWGLITGAITGLFFMANTYFTTNQTAKDVSDLQITVKAGNSQVTSLASDQALLKFRQENVESELRIIKDVLNKQSHGRAAP